MLFDDADAEGGRPESESKEEEEVGGEGAGKDKREGRCISMKDLSGIEASFLGRS